MKSFQVQPYDHPLSALDFTNRFYQLEEEFYRFQLPTPIKNPQIIHINGNAAALIDMEKEKLEDEFFRDIASGNKLFRQSTPAAAIYAGHQFGHFVPQLGDGRALLLGEINNSQGEYWEIQLKGAGQTPFSRNGDGRAVLRSTIREYLCSEAMHGLGIPTTRALSIIRSEEEVYREQIENGAVLVRLSPTFIRFGSFELFASRGQHEQVKKLADFTIKLYYPKIDKPASSTYNPYAQLLKAVVLRTASMIAQWQAVGFAHGVMNTDNMSILGLTLDYGPFGFLDTFNRDFVCNHSDYQGRYSFKNQPGIAYWNLSCLANAMLSLMTIDEAKQALQHFDKAFAEDYLNLMTRKLGIQRDYADIKDVIFNLLELLGLNKVDYSIFFRCLSDYIPGTENNEIRDLFLDREAFDQWSQTYNSLLEQETLTDQQRKIEMNKVNPKYILRNYMAQIAIDKACQDEDYSEIDNLHRILETPFDEHPDMQHYAGFPPSWAEEISVSCSS